jgi:Peptidase propeptide and YPEB domain
MEPPARSGPVGGPRTPLPGQVGRWRESVPRVTWARGLAILALFLVTLFTAKSCQKAQIRITKDRAVATAQTRIDFVPERTQVRLIRQGLNGKPFWAVSFSIPTKNGRGYKRLTTVRVNANTGKVAAVNRERGPQPADTP